jgi:hypothetical protein
VRFTPLACNFTHHCIEIMWPFKKKETASIHIDYIANPKYVSEMEEDFKNKLSEFSSRRFAIVSVQPNDGLFWEFDTLILNALRNS